MSIPHHFGIRLQSLLDVLDVSHVDKRKLHPQGYELLAHDPESRSQWLERTGMTPSGREATTLPVSAAITALSNHSVISSIHQPTYYGSGSSHTCNRRDSIVYRTYRKLTSSEDCGTTRGLLNLRDLLLIGTNSRVGGATVTEPLQEAEDDRTRREAAEPPWQGTCLQTLGQR